MSSTAGALLAILLILMGLAGLMLPKEKPPRPPDEILIE